MFDKKQKGCVKCIHLVTDVGLCNWKAFYKVKLFFIHPLWMMANLSIINIRSLTLFLNFLVETQSDDALCSVSISWSIEGAAIAGRSVVTSS